jgi:HlyD family secretion protein
MEPYHVNRGEGRCHPRVVWSRMKASSHILIWMAAAVVAVFLFVYGAGTGGMPGYVEIVEHPVASTEVGRVVGVDVEVGDRVVAGQVVARFDTAVIDAELGAERAMYEEMRDTVPGPAQVALQWQRQFAGALSVATGALDEQCRRQSEDQAELDVLAKELARVEPLVAKGLMDAERVSGTRARHAALSKAVAMHPQAIANLQQRLEETRRQNQEALETLKGGRSGVSTGTNLQAVALAQRVAGLAARQRECVLRSPANGVISQIMFRPGDVVMAGTPVVIIVEQPSSRVIGFMPEITAHDAKTGDFVRVERMYEVGVSYGAKVSALEPAVRGLPGQVNPVPGRVMRGRRVYCTFDESTDFLPGETVQIILNVPFWAPAVNFMGRFSHR